MGGEEGEGGARGRRKGGRDAPVTGLLLLVEQSFPDILSES